MLNDDDDLNEVKEEKVRIVENIKTCRFGRINDDERQRQQQVKSMNTHTHFVLKPQTINTKSQGSIAMSFDLLLLLVCQVFREIKIAFCVLIKK